MQIQNILSVHYADCVWLPIYHVYLISFKLWVQANDWINTVAQASLWCSEGYHHQLNFGQFGWYHSGFLFPFLWAFN